jgi:hypothetical protein
MDVLDIEEKVMAHLLDGEHPVLNRLREQYKLATKKIRKVDSAGFLVDYEVNAELAIPDHASFEVNDVSVKLSREDVTVGFVFFVKGGLLSLLECWTVTDLKEWPKDLKVLGIRYNSSQKDKSDLRNFEFTLKSYSAFLSKGKSG